MVDGLNEEWKKDNEYTKYEKETISKCGLPKIDSNEEEFNNKLNCIMPRLCPKQTNIFSE